MLYVKINVLRVEIGNLSLFGRARSEKLVRGWYEGRMLGYSQFVADVEGRVGRVETGVRRVEKAREVEA